MATASFSLSPDFSLSFLSFGDVWVPVADGAGVEAAGGANVGSTDAEGSVSAPGVSSSARTNRAIDMSLRRTSLLRAGMLVGDCHAVKRGGVGRSIGSFGGSRGWVRRGPVGFTAPWWLTIIRHQKRKSLLRVGCDEIDLQSGGAKYPIVAALLPWGKR